MKQIYAFRNKLAIITFVLILPLLSSAQCVSPSMYFEQPTLFSGTAGTVDAVYKFNSVYDGIDAYVTITNIVGGASLSNIDDNTFGYPAAWQPVVKTPAIQSASESYVSFRLEFKNSVDNSTFTFPCFVMSCIDVDGDNDRVREFVAANGHQSYSVSNTTTLTVTNEAGGLIKAAGTFNNFPGIDTSAYVTNINYNYVNAGKINEVRIGNITAETFYDQNRYSCIYFKPISMANYYVLPVDFVSLKSKLYKNSVDLSWTTRSIKERSNFQVERSFDAIHFEAIAEQNEKHSADSKLDYYAFADKAAYNSGKQVVYYRIKQVLPQNRVLYSEQVMVKLYESESPLVDIQVSPNPFTEKVTLVFNPLKAGMGEVRIVSLATGMEVARESFNISAGVNSMRLKNISKITAGVYVLQMYFNGTAAGSKKIIKN